MYQIQKTEYGSRVILGGTFSFEEATQFEHELAELRSMNDGPRGVLVDIRTLVPPEPRVVDIITRALGQSFESGLNRAAIVVNSPVVRGQAIQVAFRAGAAHSSRCLDASKMPDWEEQSLNWVIYGVEPDVPAITTKIRVVKS